MKLKLYSFLFIVVLLIPGFLAAQTARVQVIHNSADQAAAKVDVWLNNVKLIPDFEFRTASPFIDAPAGVDFDVTIQPAGSTDTVAPVAKFTYNLTAGETYVLIANGIVSGTGYSPANPFDIYVYTMGQEAAGSGSNTDVLVFHGATDAPSVDVDETGVGAGNIIDNMAYGDFRGYLPLATDDYVLAVKDETGSVTVASYSAPLSTLQLDGAAAVVVASGFLNPANNSNGPAFGLWVALPTGGDLIPLPAAATTRAQVIHNSADAAAATVDIYLNDAILLDDVSFRQASAFIDAPAGVPVKIDVAPSTSTSSWESIYSLNATLDAAKDYVFVASGIVSGSGYTPATPFSISIYDMAQEAAVTAGNTDVLVFHGATDAPTVDVEEVGAGAGIIVDAMSYGDFNSSGYLNLPTADYVLDVQTDDGNASVVQYSAPLSTLGLDDAAIVVLASGFLDPSVNSNGEAFGLYVALPAGGALVALPQVEDVTMNVKMAYKEFQGIFDSANDFVDVAGSFNDWGGTSIVLSNVDNNLYTTTQWLTVGTEYEFKFRINGSWDDNTAEFPFGGPARTYTPVSAGDNTITVWYNDEVPTARIQVIHNSADAAAAMVDVYMNDELGLDDFAFRTATEFMDAPAAEAFDLVIQPSTSTDTTNALARFNYTLGIDETYILVANGIVSTSGYNPGTPFDIYVYAMGQEAATTAGNTDVLVFHGATDAPAVDVVETGAGAGTIVDAMAYGEFNSDGYLNLATADYVLDIQADADNSSVAQYDAPLATLSLDDAAIVVVASGFLTPANNSDGPAFGLWVATAAGGALVELPVATSTGNILADEGSFNVYPNPVINNFSMDFELRESAEVSIEIYNLLGKKIKSTYFGMKTDGTHNIRYDISDVDNGLYFVVIKAGKDQVSKKIQVVR